MRRLAAIRAAGAAVQEIRLTPLGSTDLTRLITDTLRCEPQRATPLAQLIHGKTAGNPFFALQFIHALVEEELVTFDHGDARWRWDLDAIRAKGYTDNVVDLMVDKLNRLPVTTQKALQQLASIGNSAESAVLSAVLETSEQETEAALWEALQSGTNRPLGGLLSVCPRPRTGSGLFAHCGRSARPGSSTNREIAHRAHSP